MNKTKSNYSIRILLTFSLLLLFSINIFADDDVEFDKDGNPIFKVTPNAPRVRLNTCAYYKFFPKDTLLYSVESRDSIVINFGVPLLKKRSEEFLVICDSVGSNNHFYLQMQYTKYKASEWTSKFDKVERNSHDWVNRKFYVEIDSVGRRYGINIDDTNKVAQNSGGAFQPYLFFDFQEACSDTGLPWVILDDYDYLIENGIPMPTMTGSTIINNKGYYDIFGFKTNLLSVSRTGQGSVYYPDPKHPVRFTTILGTGGELYIGRDAKVPIFMHLEQDEKITIHSGKTVKEEGNSHYTETTFKLIKYNRINFDSTIPIQKVKSKKNKSKKK